MRRFENAEVGDLVYCRLMGLGTIISNKCSTNYPIKVSFIHPPDEDDTYTDTYTLEGRTNVSYTEPMLFYRSSTNNYLTERPEPDVDWANVVKHTLLENIHAQQGIRAIFLTTSQQNDKVWVLTQPDDKTAHLISASDWKPAEPAPYVDWANMKKGTSLVSVGYAEETQAYFLSLSSCDHIWIYYKETHTTAYSVHVSRWRPESKESHSCQKA